MKGWLAAIFFGVLGALGFYRERSKRLRNELNSAKEESEALSRQSEALRERGLLANENINEARASQFTPTDINDILRDDEGGESN